jgi:hypothetical protein
MKHKVLRLLAISQLTLSATLAAQAATVVPQSAAFFSDNRVFSGGLTASDSFDMRAAVKADSGSVAIYGTYSNGLGSGTVSANLNTRWTDYLAATTEPDLFQYNRSFSSPAPLGDAGNPDPWAGTYTYFVDDVIVNGVQDAGESAASISVASGTIQQWDLVSNVSFSDGFNPEVSWEGVNGTERYQVRLFELVGTTSGDLLDIISLPGDESTTYSVTLDGNLFASNGGSLVVAVVADDRIFNGSFNQTINRSTIFTTHTVVPIPGAAWLFGSVLLGIASLARRKI